MDEPGVGDDQAFSVGMLYSITTLLSAILYAALSDCVPLDYRVLLTSHERIRNLPRPVATTQCTSEDRGTHRTRERKGAKQGSNDISTATSSGGVHVAITKITNHFYLSIGEPITYVIAPCPTSSTAAKNCFNGLTKISCLFVPQDLTIAQSPSPSESKHLNSTTAIMGYGKDDELAINTIRLLAVSRSSLILMLPQSASVVAR